MSRFSESPSPPPHDVYEAPPPRRGGRGGGGEYDDQWIGRSRSRPRGPVRGRGGSYVQPRSRSQSRSLRDDQDRPEDAEPPPRQPRRRHRTARHELPPESVEEAPRHRGERRRGERQRPSRHGEVAGEVDEAPRERGRGRRDDRRGGGDDRRDYTRKMAEAQQAQMRAMMGGMMGQMGMGGGMNPAAMQMAMMQQMGQMGMMHPSYMQAMQQQQQMMMKQKKPSGGSSSSSGDSSSSSSDGVGNGMNPAAAMAAMAAMHGGMPGMHGQWPASASAAPPPLPPPPQAFGGQWTCACGFKNSPNNVICGGNGPMGCKADYKPPPSMANLPPPPPPPPGFQAGGENIEAFLTANDINEEAADRLKALPQHLQIAIMRRGPISDTRNPSEALLTRVRDAENAGGNSAGPSQSGEMPARRSAKASIETMIDQFRLSPGVAWMMRAMAPDKQKLCSKIDPSGQADPSGYVAEQLKEIVGD